MKRLLVLCVLVLAAATIVGAQAKKGPILDKVYIDVRTSQEIGLKDTAEGKTDVFFEYVTGPTYSALPADTKAKVDAYSIPALTYSLLLNPIPNKAPYLWKVGGKDTFNPLAIKEVRFAINFLINRKQIVDEILGGNGKVMFTMASPGQPGTYKYNLIGSKFGFTVTGNATVASGGTISVAGMGLRGANQAGNINAGETYKYAGGSYVTLPEK